MSLELLSRNCKPLQSVKEKGMIRYSQLLSSTILSKVLTSLRTDVPPELHFYSTCLLAANRDVCSRNSGQWERCHRTQTMHLPRLLFSLHQSSQLACSPKKTIGLSGLTSLRCHWVVSAAIRVVSERLLYQRPLRSCCVKEII